MRAEVFFNGRKASNLAIIIPAFNEEETVTQVIEEWTSIADRYEGNIILINDGSKDHTLEIVKNLQRNNPRLIIIDKENSGHADSCIYAYRWAIENHFRWIFQTDSDGQTDPKDFHSFWQLKDKYPVVFGYRPDRGDGIFRRFVSKMLMGVIFLFFKTYLKDANVPFRLMDSSILSSALKNIPDNIFLGNAYLTVELNRIRKIYWERISFFSRKGGKPSVGCQGFFSKGLKVINEFMRIKNGQFNCYQRNIPLLEYSTLIYLTLPYFFFWADYFKVTYAIIFSLLTMYGLHGAISFYRNNETTPVFSKVEPKSNIIKLILPLLVITFSWLFLSGSGGLWYQNADYEKHNAIFYDLVNFSGPVHYQGETGHIYYLCYYLAYYLVPSFVGKIININYGYAFSFLWTLLGLWLVINWILKLTERKSLWIILFFILFSGLDIVGSLLTKTIDIGTGVGHFEWWAGYSFWQYSSNTTLLNWVPQHAISGWLTTSLLFGLFQHAKDCRIPAMFIFGISCLWSSFVSIGLIPLMAVLFFKNGFRRFFNLKSTIPALTILIPVTLYYMGNQFPHQQVFLLRKYEFVDIWPRYLFFCLLEFGIFAFIIFPYLYNLERNNRAIFIVTIITLLLIPFYRIGMFNDLAMRASIPSLLILQIILLKLWNFYSKELKMTLVFILILGAITPLSEIARSYKFRGNHFPTDRSLMQMSDEKIAAQYLGSDNSFYYKYLAKEGKTQVSAPSKITNYLNKQ